MEMRIFDMQPLNRELSCPAEDTDGILTMAFVNFQPLNEVYNTSEAFRRGTLFPNLDKPLCVGGARK